MKINKNIIATQNTKRRLSVRHQLVIFSPSVFLFNGGVQLQTSLFWFAHRPLLLPLVAKGTYCHFNQAAALVRDKVTVFPSVCKNVFTLFFVKCFSSTLISTEQNNRFNLSKINYVTHRRPSNCDHTFLCAPLTAQQFILIKNCD